MSIKELFLFAFFTTLAIVIGIIVVNQYNQEQISLCKSLNGKVLNYRESILCLDPNRDILLNVN